MASVIKAGNATDGVQVTSDNTGILELKTGTGSGTTAVTVGTDQSVTFAQAANLPNTFGFKNRIINGAMVIDQRNAGASVTSASNGTYFLDRWRNAQNVNSKFSIQQNAGAVTPPVGFTNYLGVTSLSAYSVAAGEVAAFGQAIEGFNVADLAWGTANAQAVTLSFRVYSSLTGTFAGSIQNAAQNRSYPFTFTISSANTWTNIPLTVPGDTTGTWLTNNGIGLLLWFSLGTGTNLQGTANTWGAGEKYGVSGQVNVIGTNGATFYITGVQLEKGSTATSFDYRPYGTELQLCQRYYWKASSEGFGLAVDTRSAAGRLMNPVPMRTAATISSATFAVNSGSAGTVASITQTVYGQTLYNSAANWSATASVSVTGDISAEL